MWSFAILLLSFLVGSQCTDCFAKEKSLGAIDVAMGTLENIQFLLPNCTNDHPSSNTSECGVKEKVLALLEISTDLLSEAKRNYPNCLDDPVTEPVTETVHPIGDPTDCEDVYRQGNTTSGIYRIWTNNVLYYITRSFLVYCEMDEDGPWTVIQRRGVNFTRQDFNQDWLAYKFGFGDLNGEFWLGNDYINFLTNQAKYRLQVDLENVEGTKEYAAYEFFRVYHEQKKYMMIMGGHTGPAEDGLITSSRFFSTKDRPNTEKTDGVPCAVSRESGWWWSVGDSCKSNINGVPSTGNTDDPKNLHWEAEKKHESLAYASMKIRRQ